MFRFASPYCLLLLLLLPLPFGLKRYRRQQPTVRVPTGSLLLAAETGRLWMARWGGPAIRMIALILMILALARPQWGSHREKITSEGINIVLALDTSESMAALDFKRDGKRVNRLEAVKSVVEDFVAKRNGDRIALVVFGSEAYTQLPLTRDYRAIDLLLDRIDIGAAGQSTSIGDAIGISIKRLSDVESKSNVIILLTDGRSNSGEITPELATTIAKEKGIKIYTIGVGTRGKVPFLVQDPVFGQRVIYQRVDIDEETLQKIAQDTGGLTFRAEDTSGLQKIYDSIDQLEKTRAELTTYAEYRELYLDFLVPGLGLLVLWLVLTNTRYLEIP